MGVWAMGYAVTSGELGVSFGERKFTDLDFVDKAVMSAETPKINKQRILNRVFIKKLSFYGRYSFVTS